jgi:hypothetical protein
MGEVFRLNAPHVACEVLDSDIILLNFESGFYYNVRGTGADICTFLLAGGTLSRCISETTSHYELQPADAERDIKAFVEELIEERLVVPAESPTDPPTIRFTAAEYASPVCEKFDDMADQLLLDKIDDQSQDAQWGGAGNPGVSPAV